MKKSEINFKVNLDENNIPDSIKWNATEKPTPGEEETPAIAISLWDKTANSTLRMDLWSKEMTVDDMKKFTVDSIGGMAETIKSATGDDKMAEYMHELCQKLVQHIKEEEGK